MCPSSLGNSSFVPGEVPAGICRLGGLLAKAEIWGVSSSLSNPSIRVPWAPSPKGRLEWETGTIPI